MIVDCHTHIWQSPDQLGQVDLGDVPRTTRPRLTRRSPGGRTLWRSIPAADPDHHWQQCGSVDKSLVLGFKSRFLRAEIPNALVADYCRRDPHRLIGFAGIDPTDKAATDEVRHCREQLNLRGIVVSPANQDFHPSDSRAMAVYSLAEQLQMPVIFHPVGKFTDQSKLEYARPYLIDEVARTFPKLRIVVSQMGQPWAEETIVLLAKHANVFADIAGITARPWQAYNALVSAFESGVIEKLLFGSDFPYTSAADCIETLYSLNQMTQGTNLPVAPREALRGIVERDTVRLLGLGLPPGPEQPTESEPVNKP